MGTPTRLNDLVENGKAACEVGAWFDANAVPGALSLENIERLVVDASHIDQKKRGVMDMKDTLMPLARWLSRKEFKDRYTATDKQLQLLFY